MKSAPNAAQTENPSRMNFRICRGCLGVLTLTGSIVGIWAYLAPLHWYRQFPGWGLSWIPALGPYNEHLVKDVGAMYLAMVALSTFSLFHLTNRAVVMLTGTSWTVFNVLHLVYHLQMLRMFSARDAILNVLTLTGVLVCSLMIVVLALPRFRHRDPSSPEEKSDTS